MTSGGGHPLDNPAWASLTGAHCTFAQGTGRARRYRPEIAPFVAFPDEVDDTAWTDLLDLAGPATTVALAGAPELLDQRPPGWTLVWRGLGLQLAATDALTSGPDPEAVVLSGDDAAEMLDLVARTEPGPFMPETHRLGTYLGLRRDGKLVAMAGERLHPPGWTEISAVCTDAAYRRQGLAARLVRAVADGIRSRGETPFLHVSADNHNAIRLYEAMGFSRRREVTFAAVVTPGTPSDL